LDHILLTVIKEKENAYLKAEANAFAAGVDLEGNWGLTRDELEAMIDLQEVGHMQVAEGRQRVRYGGWTKLTT
jgi:hypothetical protein